MGWHLSLIVVCAYGTHVFSNCCLKKNGGRSCDIYSIDLGLVHFNAIPTSGSAF